MADRDWLIITTHHCDILNSDLSKEPFVEVLRAEIVRQPKADKMQAGARNPRVLQFVVADDDHSIVLRCRVHERWMLPRELLKEEAPLRFLDDKNSRLVAEWLAKRYIRSAFPNAFDGRWRHEMKPWIALLERHGSSIQGVYLRLNTLAELDEGTPYRCSLIVAVPRGMGNPGGGWLLKKEELESVFGTFWQQFSPEIEVDFVEVLGTDELTLAMLDGYQRFDADWVSFADDSPTTPSVVDMNS